MITNTHPSAQPAAVQRAKDAGHKYYFLLGHNPSWATASGNPTDTGLVKDEEELARFKQYLKDTLQYYKDNGITPDFANLTNEYWTGLFPTYQVAWEAVREVYPDFIPAVGPSAVGFDGIPEFYIPESVEAGITVEGPAWLNSGPAIPSSLTISSKTMWITLRTFRSSIPKLTASISSLKRTTPAA